MTNTPESTAVDVSGLSVRYANGWLPGRRRNETRAVDDVTLQVRCGEVFGIVGESGCGKSTLAKAIIGMLKPTAGTVVVAGHEWARLGGRQRRRAKRDIQYIFQDVRGALDPRMTILAQVREPLTIHDVGDRSERTDRALHLLRSVGIGPDMARRYPHQISGGQRQRVVIARALAPNPKVLVCDEPVSALDVSIQAQIVNLLIEIGRRDGLTMLFISHDLALVRHLTQRTAVMQAGRIVEQGPTLQLFQDPKHPFTRRLAASVPGSGIAMHDLPDLPAKEQSGEHRADHKSALAQTASVHSLSRRSVLP